MAANLKRPISVLVGRVSAQSTVSAFEALELLLADHFNPCPKQDRLGRQVGGGPLWPSLRFVIQRRLSRSIPQREIELRPKYAVRVHCGKGANSGSIRHQVALLQSVEKKLRSDIRPQTIEKLGFGKRSRQITRVGVVSRTGLIGELLCVAAP